MKQLLLILGIVGLIMYAGFVIEPPDSTSTTGSAPDAAKPAVAAPAKPSVAPDLANLDLALTATGTTAESVSITGWAAVDRQPKRSELLQTLGWTEAAVAPNNELHQYNRAGQEYIGIRWVLTGGQCRQWQRDVALVRDALKAGSDQRVTVQLETTTATADLKGLVRTAMEAVGAATEPESWSGPSDTIVAGRSARLPPSPFGVNVQIEARQIAGGRTRLSIAWPALRLDS